MIRTATAALLLSVAAVSAAAQEQYWSLGLGIGPFFENHDLFAPDSNAGAPLSGEVSYDGALFASVGYARFLSPNVRIGAEFSYFDIETETFSVTAPFTGNFTLDGDVSGGSLMFDVGYERQFSDRFGAFIEAGAGLVHVNADNVQTGPGSYGFLDDSDTVLAGKIGGGLFTRLDNGVELFGEYNYVFGQDAELSFTAPGGPLLTTVPVEFETSAHLVQFGIRVRF